jgi:hypothetical protein
MAWRYEALARTVATSLLTKLRGRQSLVSVFTSPRCCPPLHERRLRLFRYSGEYSGRLVPIRLDHIRSSCCRAVLLRTPCKMLRVEAALQPKPL